MMTLKSKLGWAGIIILTLIPLIAWYTMTPIKLRYGSTYALLTSLGQLSSLSGMPLFAIALILSGRFGFLEDFFGGMNKVYIAHHLVGGLAFILLMIHPIFLVFTYAMVSYKDAALFLIPGADWGINFGIFSLLVMMLLLIITYYIKLKYHVWKFTHQFLGLAFFLGGLHVLLVQSDVSINPFLRWYLLGLSAVGLMVYTYRTLFGFKLVTRYDFTVTAVEKASDDVITVRMIPSDDDFFPYMPGQFIFISFKARGISGEAHPFSVSSSPFDRELSVTIKAIGEYTADLLSLPVGSAARIEGPYGRFFKEHHKNQIWIAGGIGVTPFLSMARSLKNMHHRIDFYYVVRGAAEAVYLNDILEIAAREPNLRVCLYDSKVEKRITADVIKQISGDLSNIDIYVCGPPPMMKSLRTQFNALGVKNSRIHTEEFQFL